MQEGFQKMRSEGAASVSGVPTSAGINDDYYSS